MKIYKYTDGFLHAKTMLIDNFSSTVGTANFDNRSGELAFVTLDQRQEQVAQRLGFVVS